MKITLTGQSYEHPSQDANFQRSINLFPSPTGDEKIKLTQLHTSGLKELTDLSGDSVRVIMPFNNSLYVVVDETCHKVTLSADKLSATSSSIGTLPGFSGRISWARNPTQIMLVDGSSKGFIITPSTDTITEITDADFTGGVTVEFLDSYFIYNTPNAATMYSTAINNGLSVDALDVATAESNPDNLLAILAHKRELWAFGELSTEVWYNAANATGFPLSTRDGATISQGIAAPHSAVKINNMLMWLDDRRFVVVSEGYAIKTVSTNAISSKFQDYDKVDDAFAFTFRDRGHDFYQLTFPSEGKTWVYDLSTNLWHERSYRDPETDTDKQHLANCHAKFQGVDIIGAFNSGKLYLMSHKYYDDAGAPIFKVKTTSHSTEELKQFAFNSLELHAEVGKGKVTGDGSDPQILMRYSNDGGYTWSNYIPRSIGKLGEYGKRVRWNRLGSGREWIFEFTTSDPIPLGLLEAYAEVDGDGMS